MNPSYYHYRYRVPFGDLWLYASAEGMLRRIAFAPVLELQGRENRAVFDQLIEELDGYFSGRLRRFSVTFELRGTVFQRQVWKQLQCIAHAATRTYADIAAAVQRPRAVRAVGATCGANPLPLLVPCHRVIGSNGSLTGFAGGLTAKAFLLEHERVYCLGD